MNKATAEKVVAEVEESFASYIAAGYPKPFLFEGSHEDLPDDAWVISWEEGPHEWAYRFGPTNVLGVFAEPVYSWCLGLYPADKY